MKKAIVGIVTLCAALCAVMALWPTARRMGHKVREHFGHMAAQCKQMLAAQSGRRDEAVGMREHFGHMAAQCKQMLAAQSGQRDAVRGKREHNREMATLP